MQIELRQLMYALSFETTSCAMEHPSHLLNSQQTMSHRRLALSSFHLVICRPRLTFMNAHELGGFEEEARAQMPNPPRDSYPIGYRHMVRAPTSERHPSLPKKASAHLR
eukprot:7383524-Prymnesium_polylepis.1